MGKLSLNKKKDLEDGNKQKKISSFFQKGADVQKKTEEKSSLFQSVGCQKQKDSNIHGRNNKRESSSLSVSSYIEATKLKSKSVASHHAQSDDAKYNKTKQPLKEMKMLDQMVIPETQFNFTPERAVHKTACNKDNGEDLEMCNDSDCDIIPATPGACLSSEQGNKKRPFGRSFLSATLSNKPPCSNQVKVTEVKKLPKVNKVKKTSVVNSITNNKNDNWNSHDETMTRVLTEMGVSDRAKESLGLQTKDSVISEKERKVNDLFTNRSMPNDRGHAGEKRQHPSGEIGSPPYKKRTSGNTCQDKKPLGLGTRGGLMLENSQNTVVNKESESEESGSEQYEPNVSNSLKLFSKEPYQESDLNLKKFSWKSTRSPNENGTKNIKHKANDIKISNKIKSEQAHHDSALDDLIGELNSHVSNDTNKTGDVPSVKLKKKTLSVNQAVHRKREDFSTPKLKTDDNKKYRLVDHTETDDVLTDIMSELKETLTQQNKLSHEKSSSKKRQYQHKLHFSNLDKSISRQLDFKGSDLSATHKKDHVPKIADIEETLESSESQNVVDEHVTANKVCESLFEEESWLEDVEECLINVESSPFKQKLNESRDNLKYDPVIAKPPAEAFGRHIVKEVQHHGQEIVLKVETVSNTQSRTVVLQGFWIDTHVEVGDIVHIISEFDNSNTCYVTDQENFIIVNPDMLISGTTVVSTVYCMRKSVLNEKFKGMDNRNIHMLHGSIIHAFFQEVLLQCHTGKAQRHMQDIAKDILKQSGFLHEMYAIGATQDSLLEEITKLFPLVTKFVQSYLRGHKSGITNNSQPKDVEIVQIKDIEENIWSPRFGIKGKIDLTVEVKIHNDSKSGSNVSSTKTMPLELKTGKPSFSVEHKGQVTLYSMMSSDRREDPQGGLLLYLRDPQMKIVPASYSHKRDWDTLCKKQQCELSEIQSHGPLSGHGSLPRRLMAKEMAMVHRICGRGLIQLRNELAYYLKYSAKHLGNHQFGNLPEPINNERSCSKCPHLLNCAAYSSVVEKRQVSERHAMKTLIPQSIGHLSTEHLEYFRLWCEMMHLEMNSSRRIGISQLWCDIAWKREDEGEAFCSMVLCHEECSTTNSEKFIQAFKRHPHSTVDRALSLVGLARGDSIVVSAENKPLISLCMGNIHCIKDTVVKVLVDRDLRKNLEYKDIVYRLDKCDTYNSMASNFTSVSRLMENSEVGEKLRELVIERRPPQFELTLSKTTVEKVMKIMKPLNKPQKMAILKILMCKDYVLIKGYPGTGKTSTIVALVRILFAIGFSVLLTSYTHSAVDNILLKLKQHKVKFLRIGRLERIHPDIQPYAAETLSKTCNTVQQLEEFYNSYQIVATTCLGTNHVLFSRRRFDLCIVDEASQVLQPACLGPLFCSNKFVLVGDPLQLPPVVQSKEAKELGMSESLFARLDNTGGTYELNMQYRMNSEIVRLSNELVYNGALKCGSQSVADGKHKCSHTLSEDLPCWVYRALGTEVEDHVLFLDTEKVLHNKKDKSGVENKLEAAIIKYLAQQFTVVGVSQSEIGVIAPYRQQVRLLHDTLEKGLGQVEVNTVDQYQGRDKEIILLSLVKQGKNKQPRPGEILQDLRRLNVALTRAKYKLLMIGQVSCLKQYEPIKEILNVLRPTQIIDLPEDTLHYIKQTT